MRRELGEEAEVNLWAQHSLAKGQPGARREHKPPASPPHLTPEQGCTEQRFPRHWEQPWAVFSTPAEDTSA